LESDLDRVRIDDLDRVHVLVVNAHAGAGRGVHDAIDAELDGGSVDPGAVVEQDVLSQLERVEERVGRDLPGFSGVRDEPAVWRIPEKAAANVHADPCQLEAGRGVKIKRGDLVPVRDAQRAAALGRLSFGDDRRRDDRRAERYEGEDETEQAVSWVHGVFPPSAERYGRTGVPRRRSARTL